MEMKKGKSKGKGMKKMPAAIVKAMAKKKKAAGGGKGKKPTDKMKMSYGNMKPGVKKPKGTKMSSKKKK